jgi:hypothetical protein
MAFVLSSISDIVLGLLKAIKNGISYGAPRASPWSSKTILTYAKASVGHPPVSEIRRSMID